MAREGKREGEGEGEGEEEGGRGRDFTNNFKMPNNPTKDLID